MINLGRKSLFSILDEKRRTAYNEWRKENTNETFNKRIEQTPLKQTRISNLADIIEDLDLNNLNRIKIIEYCIKDERKGFIFRKVLKKSGIKPREIINYIAAKRNLNISSKRCENEYDESNRLRDDINNLLYDKIHTPYTHNYHIELWNELLEAFTKCYEKKGNDIKSELKKISLNSTSDKIKSAVMATVFSLPRLVSPMKIQTIIRTPMTSAHTQFPICNTPSAASAPS